MTSPLEVGDIIETSYGTGPYRIVDIAGGCTCSDYLQELNGRPMARAPHMHIICVDERVPPGKERKEGYSYLGGYAMTGGGRIVTVSKPHDEIRVLRKASGIQLGLF